MELNKETKPNQTKPNQITTDNRTETIKSVLLQIDRELSLKKKKRKQISNTQWRLSLLF